jgi:hypothetical protein
MKRFLVLIYILLWLAGIHLFCSEEDEISTYQNFSDPYSYHLSIAINQFSLVTLNPNYFSLSPSQHLFSLKKRKPYLEAAALGLSVNIVVWAFDFGIMREGWAKISINSILNNLKYGFKWDGGSFKTNQLEHPYHGALYFSAARTRGLTYWESTIYPFIGSFVWEYFLETNRPSMNDFIMTPLGGITLGEILYKIAGLMDSDDSRGVKSIIRKSLIFVINPMYGFSLITERGFRKRNPFEKHFYDFDLSLGIRSKHVEYPQIIVMAHLEYKDALQDNVQKINPYSWFDSRLKIDVNRKIMADKEIITTGILAGKRGKHSLFGLFGVFDYRDHPLSEKMSAVGFGPGFVMFSNSKSRLYFETNGVLSAVFGGSDSALDPTAHHSFKAKHNPYIYGPGLKGDLELDIGKKGLGRIHLGFSEYWIHSVLLHNDQFLGILSSQITLDVSSTSHFSVGYEYFLRSIYSKEGHFSHRKGSAVLLYSLKF